MKKRVIVTGGTGFIGANLVRRLLMEGHEIHLLVRPKYNPWRIDRIKKNIILHELIFEDVHSIINLFKKIKPHWIFHLATYGAYSFQTDMHKMMQTNISLTANLLKSAINQGFEAFVNTGSSSEYGYNSDRPRETDIAMPNSEYAITKLTATVLCQLKAKSHKMYIPTLRLYSVYGPYEESTRLIPTLIAHGLKNRLPPLVGPRISRDFVYVEDVCDAYLKASQKKANDYGPIYNVGSGTQISMRDLVNIAKKVMNIETMPVWKSFPNREWDMQIWRANNKKIKDELVWKAAHSFEQGLSKTTKWLQEDPFLLKYYNSRIMLK